ncbi:hypothetical protein N0V94_004849 [Neodidymelliopsis sp. IMI 364377]|nr:hypothetical protein N0V94_004849 [Neodidymelliopsis sp. IMI 364377]
MVTVTKTETLGLAPTATGTLRVPFDINSPLAHGEDWNHSIAVATLVAVGISGIILLAGLSYFVFLRFRGKCPHCPGYEDQLRKWERGEVKCITPSMVKERMRAWDLEKGRIDLQAKMHADRMSSLAMLEGRSGPESNSARRVKTLVNKASAQVKTLVKKAGVQTNETVITGRSHSVDSGKAWVGENDTGHPATWSIYQRDVIAPRQAEIDRSIREVEDGRLARLARTIEDPNNRESVLQRAVADINEIAASRAKDADAEARPSSSSSSLHTLDEEEKDTPLKPTTNSMPPPREEGESRFHERFSVATNHYLENNA